MEIVINSDYGGFGLSKEAYQYLGLEWDGYGFALNEDRTNVKLIQCVKELGKRANGEYANLKVIEIPDDIGYEISEYDGIEQIEEIHRSWS